MPIKVKDETTGEEIEAFTKQELEAERARLETEYKGKLEDKDKHVQTKLDEFLKGNQARELKDKEWETKLEEANRLATEAKGSAASSEQKRQEALKNFIMEQYGGNDPETKKKLEEGYGLINKEITNDADIVERVRLAAQVVGVSGTKNININAPVYGGYAPTVQPPSAEKEQDHQNFLEALDLTDVLPPKQ